jgi:membrane protein DedA with SNARE-associated domain
VPEILPLLNLENVAGLSATAVFFLFFFATFISEDAACVTAGVLAGQGRVSFVLGLTACFAGIFVGDILLYWTGRLFGNRVLESNMFRRFISDASVSKASKWLEKRGVAAIFLSRFVSGLRLPTYLAAGTLRTHFGWFTLYFLIASAIWTPVVFASAAYASEAFFSGGLVIGIVALFVVLRLGLHFSAWKNRRLFVGRVKRLVNWEFWPLSVFYFPVGLYVALLALRHRSLTVFTAANPAIQAGGFIGESKHEIYEGLRKSAAASHFLLRHTMLSVEEKQDINQQKAARFIAENELQFPLVLKPNAGERGKGVRIIRSLPEMDERIASLDADSILQEFADGVEASFFYFRYPNAPNGEIFSATEKRFPKLMGDGTSDLETLILRDPRAVCLAQKYLDQNIESLDCVPANGEEVQIVDIGTHSRGAIFVDGGWLKTMMLEQTIDEICRGFSGFYFGRFDIRADSFDDMMSGENFKIVELNGVTSESTNIYDKRFSLWEAYRILFRQWAIAFEIGAENRQNGIWPTRIFDLVKLLLFNRTERVKKSVASGPSVA